MFDFLLANLPIVICIVSGLLLLIVEVFTPGFGFAGISGIVLLLVATVFVWINSGPVAGLGLLVVIVALIALILSITLRSASSGKLSKSPIILEEAMRSEDGYIANADLSIFIGRQGHTCTALRPSGIAEFDGVRLNVVSDGIFVPEEIPVEIQRVEGSRIVVRTL